MLVAFPVHRRGGTWHHGSSGSEGVRTRLGDMGPRDATREELAQIQVLYPRMDYYYYHCFKRLQLLV